MPGTPQRDRPLVVYDLLEEIARLKAVGAASDALARLTAEFRRLRAEF